MDAYDPDHAPDPSAWLALSETERQALVETYHLELDESLESVTMQAAIHATVETQLAMYLMPVVRAFDRVRAGGLTRHEAVHAVGSVLAELPV